MRKNIFVVILLLCATVLAGEKQNISLEKVLKERAFTVKGISGLKSMADGIHYTSLEDKKTKLVKYAYETGEAVDTLLNLEKIDKIKDIYDYEMSADESKILFYTNRDRIYRRSFFADYYIYDRKSGHLSSLSDKENQRMAVLSPDGNQVAFIYENNIFIKNLETGEEKQITFDGEYNKIQNGTPDWVYEEEFGFNKAWEWSPDGRMIAFIRFDESEIRTFNMTKFQGSHPTLEENKLYPENYFFKYPKPGEKNSVVSVHVYHLKSGKTKTMKIGADQEQYIPRIQWTPDSEKLAITRLNRHQNHLEILLANPSSGRSKVVYEDKESEYVAEKVLDSFTILADSQHFIIMNEKSGYMHLYLMNFKGKNTVELTKNNSDVVKFYGYDEASGQLYFTAYDESPLNIALFAVHKTGENSRKLSTGFGINTASFSESYKYYINTFENVSTPKLITLHNAEGMQIRVLEDNQALLDSLENYHFSRKEFFDFETSEGVKLNGWMLKPENFDAEKLYPVLVDQYSGPGSQSVRNNWSCDWYQYLLSQGYIIVGVDTRGTGGRGEKFKKMTYMEMGKYETLDLIETAKYLQGLDFIDSKRIGIWGWSYGGFTTLLAMEKGQGIFQAGVAVAPVTNWRFYDSIYTERFMRTPQENSSGYDDNSPLFFADDLQGKLLIVHGSADDNVHMQNTMEYIEKLVQADKQFDMMIYTNRNHSIYGGNTRYHLFKKISDFILENL